MDIVSLIPGLVSAMASPSRQLNGQLSGLLSGQQSPDAPASRISQNDLAARARAAQTDQVGNDAAAKVRLAAADQVKATDLAPAQAPQPVVNTSGQLIGSRISTTA